MNCCMNVSYNQIIIFLIISDKWSSFQANEGLFDNSKGLTYLTQCLLHCYKKFRDAMTLLLSTILFLEHNKWGEN